MQHYIHKYWPEMFKFCTKSIYYHQISGLHWELFIVYLYTCMYAAYKWITINWSMFSLNLIWRWLAHMIGTTTLFLAVMVRLMMLIFVALYYILLTIRRGWSCCGRYCVFIIESLIIIPLKEAIFSLIDAFRIDAFL